LLTFSYHPLLKVSRFANDAPEQFANRAAVERAAVGLLQTGQHIALALGIAARQSGSLFQGANFHGQSRAPIQEPKQLSIYFVYFSAPMFDSHRVHPSESYFRSKIRLGSQQKSQPRLIPVWESRLAR